MQFKSLIPAFAGLAAGAALAAPTPISGPIVFGGSTYYLLSQANWTDSQAAAVALGGNLVTVNSQAEEDFIFNTFSTFNGVAANLWIGLNDAAQEGTFTWVSGETSSFTFWSGGEPNGAFPTEDYVMINQPSFGGRWNDSRDLELPFGSNFAPARGVVEVRNGVPEPASFGLAALALAGAAAGLRRRRRA